MIKIAANPLLLSFTALVLIGIQFGVSDAYAKSNSAWPGGSTTSATTSHYWRHSAGAANLDLSSSSVSIAAPVRTGQVPVNIQVADISRAVTPGQLLTPAEMIAVQQVLRSGSQSILLASNGAAAGGTLTIGRHLGQAISNLVIPEGVTVIDLSRSGNLNITGNVTDAGKLLLTTRNPGLSAVNLKADSITVEAGGQISSVLPAAYVNTAAPNLTLNLSALNNITNAGMIISNGSLSLTSGGSISNSLPAQTAAPAPVLEALGNLNLASGSGAISNTGLITSTSGIVNISSTALTEGINVLAHGGVFQALRGAINVEDSLQRGIGTVNLSGGTYLSPQLNLNGGAGNLNVNIEQATGIVNSSAHNVAIQVNTGKLTLGTMSASGDPTVVNFSTDGINISATPAIAGQQYIIVSGGTINSSASGFSINTDGSTNGGNIVMVAGAAGTFAGGSNPVMITGASTTGGIVDLSNISSLQSTGVNNGGNITLIAFAPAGGSTSQGKVLLPGNLTMQSSGGSGGLNGSVTIVAGASPGPGTDSIMLGGINNNAGTGSGGAVNISVATPNATVGNPIEIDPATGNITGSFPGGNLLNGAVALNGVINAGGTVTIATGGNITAGGSQSISAPTTILYSTGGSLGTSNIPITINSSTNLSAMGSSVFVQDPASGTAVTLTNGLAPDGSTVVNTATNGIYSLQSSGQVIILANVNAGHQISLSASGSIISSENVLAQISAGQNPTAAAINTSGTLLYVADSGLDQLLVINTSTDLVVATRPVGSAPSSVALSPDGSVVYVTNEGSNTISSFDTATLSARPTINVPGPTVMAFNTDGSRLYVASATTNTVSVIDTGTSAVVGTINPGGAPKSVSFDNANGFVYIAVAAPNEILGINPQTGAQVSIVLPSIPTSIGQCPCGTKLFVSSAVSDSVYIVSVETNDIVSTIALPAGSSPTGVAINPTGSMAYVADSGTNSVSVITTDLSAVTSTTTMPVAGNVSGNFSGFLGTNAVAYIPGSQAGIGTLSILTTPSLTAPEISLTSQNSDIRVGAGAANLTVNAHGYAIITGSGDLSSALGTAGTELQFATRNNLTINGPQSALTMDFHALNGVFTNNSTISASGDTLFIAAPTMLNNGTIENTNATGSVSLQSPSGFLQISMGSDSQIIASGTSGIIILNPALGSTVNVSGGPTGGILNASAIRIPGNVGQVVNLDVEDISGKVRIGSNAGSVTLVSASGNLMIDNIDTSSITGAGGPIVIEDTGGTITLSGNVISSGISGGRIDLFSSVTTINPNSAIEANGTSGSAGMIQFASLIGNGSVQVVNDGTISATNNSQNSGIIGFDSGASGTLTVSSSGAGIITAGQFVNFGNLDPSTLQMNGPFISVGTFTPTAPFSAGFSLGSASSTGNSIAGTIQVSLPVPKPPGPAPFRSGVSELLLLLQFANALEQSQITQQNLLDEQIGTRIATDYTPVGKQQAQPLIGAVAITASQPINSALIFESAFTPAVLANLAGWGLLSGADSGGNFISLYSGSGIFNPVQHDIVVRTHEGDIYIAQGSLVQVYETGADVCILNLYDARRGAVKVIVGNLAITLQPGREVILTRQKEASFNQVNPLPSIATRNPARVELAGGMTAFVSEFSIPSALSNVTPLKKLISSTNPRERRLALTLLKNAVLLSDLAAASGPYR